MELFTSDAKRRCSWCGEEFYESQGYLLYDRKENKLLAFCDPICLENYTWAEYACFFGCGRYIKDSGKGKKKR